MHYMHVYGWTTIKRRTIAESTGSGDFYTIKEGERVEWRRIPALMESLNVRNAHIVSAIWQTTVSYMFHVWIKTDDDDGRFVAVVV